MSSASTTASTTATSTVAEAAVAEAAVAEATKAKAAKAKAKELKKIAGAEEMEEIEEDLKEMKNWFDRNVHEHCDQCITANVMRSKGYNFVNPPVFFYKNQELGLPLTVINSNNETMYIFPIGSGQNYNKYHDVDLYEYRNEGSVLYFCRRDDRPQDAYLKLMQFTYSDILAKRDTLFFSHFCDFANP